MKKTLAILALTFAPAFAAELSNEWPHYAQDAGGNRYSPLTQITPHNVARLTQAWVYHMRPADYNSRPQPPGRGGAAGAQGRGGFGGSRFAGSQATPLVVNGMMYVATPYATVIALDSSTGKEAWVFNMPSGDRPAMRGVEYWPGEKGVAPRIVIATTSGKLMELDAATGKPSPAFGTEGTLDLKTDDVMNGFPKSQYSFSTPPLIHKNLIITGSRVQESPTQGASGDVRAWDARTGKAVWTFHSVPRPGEVGHDTWEGDSWVKRSGVNVWTGIIADERRGIVYLPFGAPTYDRYGSDRHGTNLFANCVVAVEAATGKYLWHFQTVHHDIWDLDLPSVTLIEVKRGGRTIPGIAVMNKTSILFMLDRVTGKPLYEVKEIPVPTDTDIPGEQPWPTQPMSVTPPLSRLSFDVEKDIVKVRPELEAYCRDMIKKENIVSSTAFKPLRADSSVATFPSALGGIDWGGAAFDRPRGLYIANSNNLGAPTRMGPRPDGTYAMTNFGYFWNRETREPCSQTPWGNLSAVDVNTGRIAWQVTLGTTDDLPEGSRNTGRYNIGSPMATASGLIFIGATDDSKFRAFDTKTGKELWTMKLESSANNGPVTYLGKDGRQYVAVLATGGGNGGVPYTSDAIQVFAVPK
ncbi:MAG: gcd [Bryobacterales bacterium]|nr:gcd [Bryobacterales bacterium]